MEHELLKIFDQYRNHAGVASREEVHREGYWHETFHCWFVREEEGVQYIYLQKRSALKKDYPDLLDITAAGHILAQETIQDGVREIKEELGVDVSFNELIPLGIIEYSVARDELKDNELSHVFYLKVNLTWMNTFCKKKKSLECLKQNLLTFLGYCHVKSMK